MLRAMFCQEWQMLLRAIWSCCGYVAGICWKCQHGCKICTKSPLIFSACAMKMLKQQRDDFLQRGRVSHLRPSAAKKKLDFEQNYFLVFPLHKLCVSYPTGSWMLLSLPSTYWAHRVDPGSRWSEGRLGYSRALVLDSHWNNLAAGVILGPLRAWRRVQLQIEWHWAICAVNGNDHIWSRSVTISRLLIQEMPRGWRATTKTGMEFCWREGKRGAVSLNRVMFGSHSDYLWMQKAEKQNELTHAVKRYIHIITGFFCKYWRLWRDLKKTFHSANLSRDFRSLFFFFTLFGWGKE